MENTNMPPKPSNYLVLALISTGLCCLPTGIASIIFAPKVNEAYARGDYVVAEKNSKDAKMWAFIGIGVGALVYILYFAFVGFAFLGAASA
jgi:hypothetical protein